MAAMDTLMISAGYDLLREPEPSFNALAHRRSRTKTFGTGSPRDNDCDMVDLADMAHRLHDLYPGEAEQLLDAIDQAVLYNRHNSRTPLCGLTAYYLYAGKETSELAVEIYSSLGMGRGYTEFLRSFAGALTTPTAPEVNRAENRKARSKYTPTHPTQPYRSAHLTLWRPLDDEIGRHAQIGIKTLGVPSLLSDDLWPAINGEFVCLYEVECSPGRGLYAVPMLHNGRPANLMVLISHAYPAGKILGARQREGFVLQKGYDQVEPGDTIAFYHRVEHLAQSSPTPEWQLTPETTLEAPPRISWLVSPQNTGLRQKLMLTDLRGEVLVAVSGGGCYVAS